MLDIPQREGGSGPEQLNGGHACHNVAAGCGALRVQLWPARRPRWTPCSCRCSLSTSACPPPCRPPPNLAAQVLLKLDLAETREFFAAFFALSDFHWHGFLSSRLSFLELIAFGLSLFAKSSNAARINLLQARRRLDGWGCRHRVVGCVGCVGCVWCAERGWDNQGTETPPLPLPLAALRRKGCRAWL